MKTFRLESEIDTPFRPRATLVVLSPDGAKLAVRNGKRIVVHDTTGLAKLGELSVPALESASAWALSPDGTRLAIAKLGSVSVVDAQGKTIATCELPDGIDAPRALAFDADGSRLWASTELGEEEEYDGDSLVTHVFELSLPDLTLARRAFLPCVFEEQAHRLVPRGDRCLFRIGCGQDGAWVYALAPGDEEEILTATELAPDRGVNDVCSSGDVCTLLANDRIVRLGFPDLEERGETALPDGLEIVQWGDAGGGFTFVPVASEGEMGPMDLLAFETPSGALIAHGKGLGSYFVGAAAGGRAVVATPKGDQAAVRVYAID